MFVVFCKCEIRGSRNFDGIFYVFHVFDLQETLLWNRIWMFLVA